MQEEEATTLARVEKGRDVDDDEVMRVNEAEVGMMQAPSPTERKGNPERSELMRLLSDAATAVREEEEEEEEEEREIMDGVTAVDAEHIEEAIEGACESVLVQVVEVEVKGNDTPKDELEGEAVMEAPDEDSARGAPSRDNILVLTKPEGV